MAFAIVEVCINCWACELVCPNNAIVEAKPHFFIAAEQCTECAGDYAEPQCVGICPIEGAIVDEYQKPLNPLGSLIPIPLKQRRETLTVP
ncbi:MAG: 4Fe-4S binding protein [Thioploca sp.]|nr:4Fe-4S binding protein [Thioploca sp.]